MKIFFFFFKKPYFVCLILHTLLKYYKYPAQSHNPRKLSNLSYPIRSLMKQNNLIKYFLLLQINSKYSEELAEECLEWIRLITGEPDNTSGDMDNFYEVLKDGTVLCKYVSFVMLQQ